MTFPGNDAVRSAAVAAPVARLFAGPALSGTVLGVFSAAAVVGVESADGPRVVSLLSPRASGVPIGIRIPGDAGWLTALRPGLPVSIDDGRLAVGGLTVRAARSWRTAAPTIQPHPAALEILGDRLVAAPIGIDPQKVRELAAALQAGEPCTARESRTAGKIRTAGGGERVMGSLVGLGAGLTPGGDDVLAGLLIGLRASGQTAAAARVFAAVSRDAGGRPLTDRTTAISAELLRLAARGDSCLEALRLLRAMHGTAPVGARAAELSSSIDGLFAVGHTSGADLATGLLLGLRHHATSDLLSRSEFTSERVT